MSKIRIVFATDEAQGFGNKGDMPWPHNAEDLKLFKESTAGHVLIMGRKTFESLPGRLPGREHLVLSSMPIISAKNGAQPDATCDTGLAALLKEAMQYNKPIAIIGGAKLIREAMPLADEVHYTLHNSKYEADTEVPISAFDILVSQYVLELSAVNAEAGLTHSQWSRKHV